MGNWRSVNMVGTCKAEEVEKLKAACLSDDYTNWHCLAYTKWPSLCGIHDWPKEKINEIGNLAERDYSVEDIAEQLRKLVAVAPSLELVVHCGGDYESKECVATVTVKNGIVEVCPPQVKLLMDHLVAICKCYGWDHTKWDNGERSNSCE